MLVLSLFKSKEIQVKPLVCDFHVERISWDRKIVAHTIQSSSSSLARVAQVIR